MTFLYILLSVIVVSLISLVGVFTLTWQKDKLSKITVFLVSFAVGGLFGDVFIHLLPESYERLGSGLSTSFYVIAGILVFFVLEKFLRWRHCHIPASKEHYHPVVAMNLIGDALHNFIDGMLIGASYTVSIPIGMTTTLAIILHEIPQEIGDFGILIYGGLTAKKALFFNFLSATLAIAGAVIAAVLGNCFSVFAVVLLPVTAGGFLYMAGSDLIPELQHDVKVSTSFFQFLFIVLGVLVMSLLVFLEQ